MMRSNRESSIENRRDRYENIIYKAVADFEHILLHGADADSLGIANNFTGIEIVTLPEYDKTNGVYVFQTQIKIGETNVAGPSEKLNTAIANRIKYDLENHNIDGEVEVKSVNQAWRIIVKIEKN